MEQKEEGGRWGVDGIVDDHETLQICLNTYRWIQPFLPFLPQYIQFFHETETVQEMNPRSVSSIDEMITIVQKHENSKTPTTSYGPPPPPPEPPPPSNLDLPGNRDDIHKFNVPVGKRPYLVGFDISENYDTSLHIATSANISKTVEKIVKNHVCHLTMEQLELQNKYHNTSLCKVSTNGYVRIVKTMLISLMLP
ncbi:unnamed protein product [Lactuca saligna]|uniref:Uncharacterized protein n=1 Tax=Lactuca saligna TaxID=75948 RepID=A0AA35ZVF3_LACSI|nr:unnamed protein product [Lactuca saligna]